MSVKEHVLKANITQHNLEAQFYDGIHLEIFNFVEQRRLIRRLRFACSSVVCNSSWALDFGCGTGNVTGKLLELGWKVIAADVSKEMLKILIQKYSNAYSSGRLITHLLKNNEIDFPDQYFQLVTSYSVLHHVYDYMSAIKEMTRVLRGGGLLYLDHESNDAYWQLSRCNSYKLYRKVSDLSNYIYLRYLLGIEMPIKDYSLIDYRSNESKAINWNIVKKFLLDNGFSVNEYRYLLHRLFLPDPLYLIYTFVFSQHKDMISLLCIKKSS